VSPNELNAEQRAIINHIQGAVLVLAPVGTGKTRVLTERVVHAINKGILPNKILCLTFTNRAAKEMSERLARYCPHHLSKLTIKTFHGLCSSMLRTEAREIGLPSDFVVYDDADCIELVKEVFSVSDHREAQSVFFKIADCKNQAKNHQLSLNISLHELYLLQGNKFADCASQYQMMLQKRHALDFADLLFYVRAMLSQERDINQRWSEKFDFIQVDEVQDTHLSEYQVVSHLAKRSGNLTMIGDLDQTIYEWRGSEPYEVISQFNDNFYPTKYLLTWNYRATQTLLKAASAFADSFETRQTKITPSPNCELGELIQVQRAKNEESEAEWISRKVQELAKIQTNIDYSKVAVLTRSHKRIEIVSRMLEKMNIPCLTIEQFQFFMRQEVKDALAYLRLIINPFDTSAMRRMLLRPKRGISEKTIKNLIKKGEICGLSLTDMVSSKTFIQGDPFGKLIKAYTSGSIVVFDVETTGFSISQDEVIEIAAVRLVNGVPKDKFHTYIVNTVSVGDSELIHGYSDLFLKKYGELSQNAFNKFFDFIQDSMLVGHNIIFDIKMITAQAQKASLSTPKLPWEDTLDLSRRFIRAERYTLESLAKHLNLKHLPTHQGMDDVRTTIDLLVVLIPLIQKNSDARQNLAIQYQEEFEELAKQINDWRDSSQNLRPPELLNKVLIESQLYSYYQSDTKRLQNLLFLINIFQELDDNDLHPDTALRTLLEHTALAKNLDKIFKDNNQIPIITVHQSKGLEFDIVFIAGATEDEFPSFLSIRDDKLEEEKRLFYVAMTRAKKKLFISSFAQDSRGYSKSPSPFINSIPKEYIYEQ
jgi:DNA helicase-2/ATP-dependent DNA helicase PcrA